MIVSSKIDALVNEWTAPPFDNETIQEIKDCIESGNVNELEDRFYRQLEFGTGGLRGVIGAGTNRMNIYTVGMAAQGLARYIQSQGLDSRGIVIARDSRRMSDVFARETASIMAGAGIKVYFFEDLAPTPLASFAVGELNAASAVVITASHNPPAYNGFKVYWETGGQIVPPHDANIINEVRNITSVSQIKKINFNDAFAAGLIECIDERVTRSYISKLDNARLIRKKHSSVKIVYSPLHGAGYKIVIKKWQYYW